MARKLTASRNDVATHLEEQHAAGIPDSADESSFVSFAGGPYTSVLDRARDLLRSRPA